MSRWSRRNFLRSSLVLGGALAGCPMPPAKEAPTEPALDGSSRPEVMWEARPEARPEAGSEPQPSEPLRPEPGPDDAGQPRETPADATPDASPCSNPFAGGTMKAVIPFVNEGGRPLDTLTGKGWDGRLYSDLSSLSPATLITSNERFFVRTRYPDRIDESKPWQIKLHGHVQAPVTLSMDDLKGMIQPMGVVLLECSGNGKGGSYGLLSAARWDGVPIEQVLAKVTATAKATRVLLSGFDDHSTPSTHSTPGCSWVFTPAQLKQYGAFLATHMNGVPLPKDHGFPVRLIMPRWYGCTNVKWLNEIKLVDDAEPATSQMKEFASRTHQSQAHALAKDYTAANMQQSAMPIRIEQWEVKGGLLYRVIGIMWGGEKPTTALSIQYSSNGPFEKVTVCPSPSTNDTWSLWEHAWKPTAAGTYSLRMRVDDPTIPTLRLDRAFYLRQVRISRV